MLARIDPWKGQIVLLEAFARAFPGRECGCSSPAMRYSGTRSTSPAQRRATELEVADRVEFLGHVDDVGTLLAGWDIAVQASTRPEPLGQNVLQYLAAGRATVVAGEGGPLSGSSTASTACACPRARWPPGDALRRLRAGPALRELLAAAAAGARRICSTTTR